MALISSLFPLFHLTFWRLHKHSFSLDFFKIVLDRNAPPSESYKCTCYTQRSQRISQQVTWNFNYIYSGTWNNWESVSVHYQKVFCFILDSRNYRANISLPSEVVVPNHGGFCIPGNVWQCQEVFLIVTASESATYLVGREQQCCSTTYHTQDLTLQNVD